MAYPSIYGVTYSYTGFQQSQQGISAFPGTQLDADLAGLDASIANLATFVQSVMRADGALNNGIVTFDSLAPGLQFNVLSMAGAVNFTPVGGISSTNVQNALAEVDVEKVALANLAAIALSGSANDLVVQSGTFVPSITFAAPGDLAVVYSIQAGFYVKIGNLVYVSMRLTTTTFTFTTASGALSIAGLPFPTDTRTNYFATGAATFQGFNAKAGYTQIVPRAALNVSALGLIACGFNSASVGLAAADCTSGNQLVLTISAVYLTGP